MTLEAKFKQEQIIPEVIDQAPTSTLKVIFQDEEVNLGNELTPTQVKSAPTVSWTPEANSYYTLLLTDPDAPSRANPIRREFLHWLVGNIPGEDVGRGEVLAEFMSSAPPKDSDLHRYTFLLFKQKGKVDFEWATLKDNSREGRRHFSAKKFAETYSFGVPVAGNYYLAQYDEYVDEINDRLANT